MVERASAKKKEPTKSIIPAGNDEDEPDERANLREYEDHLRFNEHALDEALIEQPDIFYRVSKAYAMAISRRDGAKLELEQATAELDKTLRERAADRDEKITENGIRQQIIIAPKIMDLEKQLGDAQLRVAKWGALKEAYIQRSYAVKDMVALYQANYFQNHVGGGARDAAITSQADQVRRGAGEERRNRQA